MCEWGDSVILKVPIMAEASHTGELYWKEVGVDRCLAPFVQALNDAGLLTGGCCCGHGKEGQEKFIGLHDGTMLTFTRFDPLSRIDGLGEVTE